jgi:hypothetical protein
VAIAWALLPLLPLVGREARADKLPVAVLSAETDGKGDRALVIRLTDALRDHLATIPTVRLLPPRELAELKLIFGCLDAQPACMTNAGKSLGARRMVYASVVRKARLLTALISVVEVDRGRIQKKSYPFISTDLPAVGRLAAGALAELLPRTQLPAQLQVTALPSGASVFLDATLAGRAANDGATVTVETTPGPHTLRVEHPEHGRWERSVVLLGGASEALRAELGDHRTGAPRGAPMLGATEGPSADTTEGAGLLEPAPSSGGQTAPMDEPDGRDGARGPTRAWEKMARYGATVGAVGALAAGVYFTLRVASLNKDNDPCRDPDGGGPGVAMSTGPECTAAEVQQRLDDASSAQTLQFVMYGTAAALTGIAGYLWYRALTHSSSGETSAGRSPAPRFELTTIPSGIGAGARFEF